MVALVDRYHPARKELPKLAANRRAFGQATIRHAVFGIVLGLVEDTLNDRSSDGLARPLTAPKRPQAANLTLLLHSNGWSLAQAVRAGARPHRIWDPRLVCPVRRSQQVVRKLHKEV